MDIAVGIKRNWSIKKTRSDWCQHLEHFLNTLEQQSSDDIVLDHKKQGVMIAEMVRLNEKLESRFDKYFLWGRNASCGNLNIDLCHFQP